VVIGAFGGPSPGHAPRPPFKSNRHANGTLATKMRVVVVVIVVGSKRKDRSEKLLI
jgi:hypothetical protein